IDPLPDQNGDLDWGDGREVRLVYRPASDLIVSLGARYGETNGGTPWARRQEVADNYCVHFGGSCNANSLIISPVNYSISDLREGEDHTVVEFLVGQEIGFGGLDESSLSAGVRYAELGSETSAHIFGQTNWNIPPEEGNPLKYFVQNTTFDQYDATLAAAREFEGAGPVLSWEASKALLGGPETGALRLDWSVTGGALFGKRKTVVEIGDEAIAHRFTAVGIFLGTVINDQPQTRTITPATTLVRSESVTVPTYGASLGLSYKIGGFKIGTGYRWERYDDAIDGGFMEAEDADRTIDGPYFKIAVGFGG
ncbi:MAG TPA: Lpg1974 family pore-forming outer membrane protein, partial [Caulobacteraceae bacterium]|nr:Lpg1974 family pore-forming outer membrane protein [Caulobacteraceae bacterium]